jgi:hypothetical protein
VFALHNLEEIPGMARWTKRINASVSITRPQFAAAVTLLTLIVVVITLFAAQPDAPLWLIHLLLAVQMVIFVNVFIPHVAMTIYYRSYNPGLITAVSLNLPFSLYLFHRALVEGYLDWGGLLLMLVAAPILMSVAVRLSLISGRRIIQVIKPDLH